MAAFQMAKTKSLSTTKTHEFIINDMRHTI